MIILKKSTVPYLSGNVIWFEPLPNSLNFLSTVYRQSTANYNLFGYKRDDFYTKLIDLTQGNLEIEAAFDKDTSYEIRRARKDGLLTSIEADVQTFIDFYNAFARTKKLRQLGKSILGYGDKLIVTKALAEGASLVMHAYLLDASNKRVRLLHSASLYRNEPSGNHRRALVGRANRFLHAEDMLFFKAEGYTTYDMGGYAFETKDLNLKRINEFKDGFGGQLVIESDYWPKVLLFVLNFSALGRKLINKL